MSRRLSSVAIVILLTAGLAAGLVAAQRSATRTGGSTASVTPAARWDRAVDAWDAGRYPEALGDLIALLDSAAAEYHDRIALLTGELFPSIDLTADGRNPRLSANGRYAAYDLGPTTDPITRIVGVAPAAPLIAELHTASLVFDSTGTRVAWLRPARAGDPTTSAIVVGDLSTDRTWLAGGLLKASLVWSADGRHVIFIGGDPADPSRSDVYAVGDDGAPVKLSAEPGHKTRVLVDSSGAAVVYTLTAQSPWGGGQRGAGPAGPAAAADTTVVVLNLKTKATRTITGISGASLTMSADGGTLAWIARGVNGSLALNRTPTPGGPVAIVRTTSGAERMDAPALSPDGTLVAYQFMASVGSSTDWDIYVTDQTGTHRRVTFDIQHDVLPRFLTQATLLGLIGEPRHRRSHLYDLATGSRRRVFANNTLRTISPEYVWAPSPEGAHLAVEADRDGDTVSAAHSVSVLDLTRKVTTADLRARLERQLAHEADLRQHMQQAFRPIADLVRAVVARISPNRVYQYQRAQFDFGSKYISQPGNAKAIEYLYQMYSSFGYTPERQWFAPAGRGQGAAAAARTANVVATLTGTENPELIYVVSSHFDSVAGGPGADDDTSGTSALLEAARALADTPLPATVVFASFTGEEAGLLGSREFVRLAAERKWTIAGALNNDMIGWSGESGRMDNTIRYSNAGIRDIQHGAAFLFTDLVLYDAKYYRGTDAAAFYEGWGDIVGGIGSYPVLGNPNYHQATDLLETINFRQVAETAKVTAATLIYLASSPSRLKDLRATRTAKGIELTWTLSPETGVTTYIVAYGPAGDPLQRRITVRAPSAILPLLEGGTQIAVKAVNRRGLEGWDWARTVVP